MKAFVSSHRSDFHPIIAQRGRGYQRFEPNKRLAGSDSLLGGQPVEVGRGGSLPFISGLISVETHVTGLDSDSHVREATADL